MAGDQEGNVTIIIRKKKGGGGGHHGGAWKVAYADFVTAMMAFFLLLWLLNATTTEQKLGISNYFDPSGAVKNQGGGEGVLGGQSPAPSGAQRSMSAPIAMMVPMAAKPSAGDAEDSDDPNIKRPTSKELTEDELQEVMAKKEQSEFEKAEAVLRQAIQSVPELKNLADSLKIDQTPEGLRIQLIDQDKLSMFPKGGSRLEEHARKLLGLVANAIKGLPNKLSLSGHTDSVPYQTVTGYTNWELSADRANASRKALIEAGIQPDRIAQVVGKADKDHLFPKEPNSPQNRRISIVLQRETPIPTAQRQSPGQPPKPTQKAEETPPAPKGPLVNPPSVPGTLGPAAPRVIDPPPPRRP